MKKKEYTYPIIEVLTINSERVMALGDPSNAGAYGGPPAPRRDPAF